MDETFKIPCTPTPPYYMHKASWKEIHYLLALCPIKPSSKCISNWILQRYCSWLPCSIYSNFRGRKLIISFPADHIFPLPLWLLTFRLWPHHAAWGLWTFLLFSIHCLSSETDLFWSTVPSNSSCTSFLNPQGKSIKGVWNIPDPAGLGTKPCHVGHKTLLVRHTVAA